VDRKAWEEKGRAYTKHSANRRRSSNSIVTFSASAKRLPGDQRRDATAIWADRYRLELFTRARRRTQDIDRLLQFRLGRPQGRAGRQSGSMRGSTMRKELEGLWPRPLTIRPWAGLTDGTPRGGVFPRMFSAIRAEGHRQKGRDPRDRRFSKKKVRRTDPAGFLRITDDTTMKKLGKQTLLGTTVR